MSDSPGTGLDLEELELQFLPAWAKESPDTNRYAGFKGGTDAAPAGRHDRHGRRDPRPDRDRPRESRSDERHGPRQDRGRPQRKGDRRFGDVRREDRTAPAPPLPEVTVSFIPEEKGVESIARQIKLTGRAYPIFDIARLILRKPERYHVTFGTVRRPDGQVAQALWTCNLDDTLWLSEQEAIDHVLLRHFETFYQAEKAATEPPKGTYTFVAQCGLSGELLGPPNLHEVQLRMRKLHADRFGRMPFDAYKSKIRIVKDEATVKKWIEQQSWKTEYNCLNIPEPKKLSSREEAEKHFREVHQPNIVRTVESHTLSGRSAQQLPSQPLRWLLRKTWDEQSRFPLKLVTLLSHQFATYGLQFFKVNRTVTHVAVARPHFLDVQVTPVSDGITRIVQFINATSYCTRKKLLDALAPMTKPAPSNETTSAIRESATTTQGEGGPVSQTPATSAAPSPVEPTPEQTSVIADLHWLIHQGHVLEFANGKLETAKKPLAKPAKPQAHGIESGVPPAPDSEPATDQKPKSDVVEPVVDSETPPPVMESTSGRSAAPLPDTTSAAPETHAVTTPGEHS